MEYTCISVLNEQQLEKSFIYGSIFNIIYNINRPTVGVQVWPVSPLAILTGRFVEDSLVRLARNALPATAQLLLNDLQLMMGERGLILQHMYMSYILYYIYMRLGDFLVSNVGIIIRDADVPYGLDKSWLETIPGMYSCCCVIIVETRSNCTQHVTAPSCYRHGLKHLCEILEYIAAAVDIIRVNEKKILYIERVDTSNSTSIGLYVYSTV